MCLCADITCIHLNWDDEKEEKKVSASEKIDIFSQCRFGFVPAPICCLFESFQFVCNRCDLIFTENRLLYRFEDEEKGNAKGMDEKCVAYHIEVCFFSLALSFFFLSSVSLIM